MKHTAVVLPFLMCFILLQGCATRSKNVKNENAFIENVTITEQSRNMPVVNENIETDSSENVTIVLSPQPELFEPTPAIETTQIPEPIPAPKPTTTPSLLSKTEKSFFIEDTGYVNNNAVYAYIHSQKGSISDRDILIIDLYFEEAVREGINPDIAIAQMLHHTNFLRNNDLISKYNYARFTQTRDWPGRFRDEREGVLAHIQHLKFYSNGSLKYPNDNVDPRYSILRDNGYLGKYSTIEDLPWVERVGSTVNTNYINSVRQQLQRLWEITDLANIN